MADTASIDQNAEQLFAALTAHDYDVVRACFAPGARAWSNMSGAEQDVEGLIAFLPLMRAGIGDHRYTDVRRLVAEDGFVEQHRVTSTRADGTELDLGDVCVVARVDADGKVTRLDEYLDTAHVKRVITPA